jgi:hypothetical protein
MCDIRQGREKETRAELARQLIDAFVAICGLDETMINVEFTQHEGDEMYHAMYGGLGDDWHAGQPDTLNGRAPYGMAPTKETMPPCLRYSSV